MSVNAYSRKRKHENLPLQHAKRSNSNHDYYDRRICLKNVPTPMTKPQVLKLIEDFEGVTVYMPTNTFNMKFDTKLVFMDFEKPWEAKVAIKLINMTNMSNISASFAIVNEKVSFLPPLAHRTTLFPQGRTPVHGNCAYCIKFDASLVCEVCFSSYSGTFYCNEEHQKRDWARHKPDCKPLPKLLLPAEAEAARLNAMETKPKTKFFVPHVESFKAGDSVILVSVASERVIYIRPVHEDFGQLIASIKQYAEKAPKITEKPEVNDTCLALFRGEYCRAQIIDVFERDSEGNDLMCFILDYGFSKKYTWNSLKKLGYKQRAFPRQTFKVILEGVKLENVSENVSKYMCDILDRKEKLEVLKQEVRGNDRFVVLKRPNNETINNTLNQMSEIKQKESNEPCQRILYDESKVVDISVGKNIKIRITDVTHMEKGYISCMPADKQMLLWKKEKDINDYGYSSADAEVPYKPILNEICMVKNGSRWERAAAVEGLDDKTEAMMMLVDKFALETIKIENIRRLPSNLATGFFAQLCFVEEITEDNLSVAREKIQPRSLITADDVRHDDDRDSFVLSFKFLTNQE